MNGFSTLQEREKRLKGVPKSCTNWRPRTPIPYAI